MVILPEKWNDWKITRLIGEGSFGMVYEACRKEDLSLRCAVKIITIPSDDSEKSAMLREMRDTAAVRSCLQDLTGNYVSEIRTKET